MKRHLTIAILTATISYFAIQYIDSTELFKDKKPYIK